MRDYLRGILEIVSFIAILILTILLIKQCGREPDVVEVEKVVYKTDTTIVNVVDTFCYWKPCPIVLLPIRDTQFLVISDNKKDTTAVKIPKVSKVYKDSIVECQISGGYFAELDYLKVHQKKSYITIHDSETIYKKPKFVVSLGVTAGYDPCYNKMSYMIGVHCGIPIWSYYGKR